MDGELIRDRLVEAARDCGEITVADDGARTRLCAGGVEFAAIEVRRDGAELSLRLPGGHRLPGIVKLFSGGDDVARHRLRIRRVEQVDGQVRAWLCEAYRMAAST